MRLIDTKVNKASINMAIDEALLTSKTPVLRFYQWKPAALSLGYFQDLKEINLKQCKKNKIDLVRRLTGGKTVLHDNELTYSLIIDKHLMPKSIIDSYKLISKPILNTLNSLGIKAEMKGEVKKPKTSSAICFNVPSYYEITVKNKKIVGSAQKRVNKKLLQHGSILIDIDYTKLISCFNIKDKEQAIENSKNRITSIKKEIKDKKLTNNQILNQLKPRLIKEFEKEFNLKTKKSKLSTKELKLAKTLAKTKYSKDEWNYKK